MDERRRHFRYPVTIQLNISDLFRKGFDGIHDLESPIEVADISCSGLCFVSECILPVGYYLNACVQIEPYSTPPAFTGIKILRVEFVNRTLYRYGCEFTNLPDDLLSIIDTYSMSR